MGLHPDKPLCTGIPKNVGQFVALVQKIDGNDQRAHLCQGVIGDDEFRAGWHHEYALVAASESRYGKAIGHAICQSI